MTHHIKLSEHFAEAVLLGRKNFEIRNNDRGYQFGDLVQFQVMGKEGPVEHELNALTYEITYVLSGWGLKEGYVVFGIREVKV